MPVSCSAPGCTQRFKKESNISFYRFPKEPLRKLAWLRAIRRRDPDDPKKFWEPASHDRLCGLHFNGPPSTDPTHPDYAPSKFCFTPAQKKTQSVEGRYERVVRRRLFLSEIKENNQENYAEHDEVLFSEINNKNAEPGVEVAAEALLLLCEGATTDKGTDPFPDPLQAEYDRLKSDHDALKQEYNRLLDENRKLKGDIEKNKFTHKNLTNSEINSLTGVPSSAVFIWILTLISLSVKTVGKLCKGDMLLLVLMKLRLNLTNRDLAMRFKICPTQVSEIICQLLPKLAKRFEFLIKWPSRATIMKNMPKSFKRSYKKCRVIIDCSEVFIQRPSNLDARAKTWSNYKHHNTLKFLIGITPYGQVSFLSKCWGGRVSDKEITARSNFYDKLEHGDLVLADRGFLIADELAMHGASLAIPPFAKGKTQFSQREVECARRLSKSRIHVERAIERVKRFLILKNTLPISQIRHADSILIICGAITNLMPKLVK